MSQGWANTDWGASFLPSPPRPMACLSMSWRCPTLTRAPPPPGEQPQPGALCSATPTGQPWPTPSQCQLYCWGQGCQQQRLTRRGWLLPAVQQWAGRTVQHVKCLLPISQSWGRSGAQRRHWLPQALGCPTCMWGQQKGRAPFSAPQHLAPSPP